MRCVKTPFNYVTRLTSQNRNTSVPLVETGPEIYFLNSSSTVNALFLEFWLDTESRITNRVGADLATGTGAGRTGKSVVASDVDDLRYSVIYES